MLSEASTLEDHYPGSYKATIVTIEATKLASNWGPNTLQIYYVDPIRNLKHELSDWTATPRQGQRDSVP